MSQALKLRILPTAQSAARATADHISDKIRTGSIRVLGLATGRSPIAVYRSIADQVAAQELDLRAIESFNLDEYVGLNAADPSSFHAYMQRHLFSHVSFRRSHLLDGDAPDPLAECRRYERDIIAAGGINLQLLGIGRNGHIGFNEPGSAHDSHTRPVTLSASTRAANQSDFPAGQTVPEQALTMGIGTIFEARAIVLLATGAAKSAALRDALQGPVNIDCPASALQAHPDLTVFADVDAASQLDAAFADRQGQWD